MSRWYAVNVAKGEQCDELCTRPSIYSNPFRIGTHGDRTEVLRAYRNWLGTVPDLVAKARRELANKSRLGCVCKPRDCHVDILIEFMERPE